MGVGWAGYCAPGGSVGLWGRPGPAPGVENVFRVGGGRWSLLCVWGEGWEGPPHWALGFSGILYLSSLVGLGEGGGGEKVGMLWIWHIFSQPWRRTPNSVTYCVSAYLFVVNI